MEEKPMKIGPLALIGGVGAVAAVAVSGSIAFLVGRIDGMELRAQRAGYNECALELARETEKVRKETDARIERERQRLQDRIREAAEQTKEWQDAYDKALVTARANPALSRCLDMRVPSGLLPAQAAAGDPRRSSGT
jgi:hypothetical protein